MKIVNLSDKLASFAGITMTDKHEILLYLQTNKPFDLKEVKSTWFMPCIWSGVVTYTELIPMVDLVYRNGKPAKYIMVLALNLWEVLHTEGTQIEEYCQGVVITRDGGKFVMFNKNVETYSLPQCRLLDYELFRDKKYIRHITTFANDGVDCKTQQWRDFASNCLVVV